MKGKRSKALRSVLAGLVSASMVFTMSFPTALANAADGVNGLSATDVAQLGTPEWAIDDGRNERGVSAQAVLPDAYDLRNDDLVTPVKSQNPWSSCWAFGGTAAAETSVLSAYGSTYQESKLDLSERHLAYFALQPVTASVNPTQMGEGIHTYDTSSNSAFSAGGMPVFVTTLFSQGVGPVPESEFPYRGVGAGGKASTTGLDDFNKDPVGETKKQLAVAAASSGMTADQLISQYALMQGTSEAEMLQFFVDTFRNNYAEGMAYSSNDDWSIPDTNATGASNRLATAGAVLKNGNVLPEYWDSGATAPSSTSVNAIKQELTRGHGVAVMYHADRSGTFTQGGENENNPKGIRYNQHIGDTTQTDAGGKDVTLKANHGACIVGWDDDYPSSEFSTAPAGNGAWIVKNSWGSTADAGPDDLGNVVNEHKYGIMENGEYTGYFYLSYYDKSIQQPETLDFTANLGTDGGFYTFQHDYMPACGGFFTTASTSGENYQSSANVFGAGETAINLRSVSTRTSEADMRVTFAIYLLNGNTQNPTDGTLVYRTSRNFEYGGFHRVDLETPVAIKAGKRFSIVCTASTLDADGRRSYTVSANKGISKATADRYRDSGVQVNMYSEARVNAGESFVYSDGKWQDWSQYLANSKALTGGEPIDNFSIKAYAEPAGLQAGKTATAGTGATKAKYTATTASTVTYKAVSSKKAKKVTVPATVKINGKTYKVNKIANRAFNGSAATNIVVGDNINQIYRTTFHGAKKVKTITLGKNVKKVAAESFTTNKALRKLVLKTRKLTVKSSVKGSLKGSKVARVTVNVGTAKQDRSYVKKYKKVFAGKKPAAGKSVKVIR